MTTATAEHYNPVGKAEIIDTWRKRGRMPAPTAGIGIPVLCSDFLSVQEVSHPANQIMYAVFMGAVVTVGCNMVSGF
jgi:hypothetical protein